MAVSGGVDSMVLLDVLAAQKDLDLVVAHFDHGIRADSAEDRQLVQTAAANYGLPFACVQGRLGPAASEEVARQARYAFLEEVQRKYRARAIVLAHHQDDVLETMLINLIRGTGRRGLSSLRSTDARQRPLLEYTKNELVRYAQSKSIVWREDSTNSNVHYLRNRLRQQVVPRIGTDQRATLLRIYHDSLRYNGEIDRILPHILRTMGQDGALSRHVFIMLPHAIAREALANYLRENQTHNLTARLLERLTIAIKTAQPHTIHDIDAAHTLVITKKTYKIMPRSS